MKSIIIPLILLSTFAFGQQPSKLSFDFGMGKSIFAMSELNQTFIEDFAIDKNLLTSKIENGNNYVLQYKYQPNRLIDFGIYMNYQYGKTSGSPKFYETNEIGQTIKTHNGDFSVVTSAYGVGITSSLYINHLLKFYNSDNLLVKNLKIASEISGGIGMSEAIAELRFPTLQKSSLYNSFYSNDFQGQIAIKLEYDYIKNPFIGTIGCKFGYQYYQTNIMKDVYGEEWKVENSPINLDFSGLFGLVYIGFGK